MMPTAPEQVVVFERLRGAMSTAPGNRGRTPPWRADWVESYLRALGVTDRAVVQSVVEDLAANSIADPDDLIAHIHGRLDEGGTKASAPAIPVAPPSASPGEMPRRDLAPVWSKTARHPRGLSWRIIATVWTGLVSLLMSVIEHGP